MKRTVLFLFIAGSLISCKHNKQADPVSAVQYDSLYHAAVFTDSARLSKIRQYLPVIDSLYRKHAEENHFPAISFGIVVDGELIYTNSYGYTDITKKIPASSRCI